MFTPRQPGEKRYWLVKSEPSTFSFDDLMAAKDRTTHWDGVRNFVARNFMRDGMKLGDQVYFYHSSVNPQAIVGVAEVVREAYPDKTAFDKSHHGYDSDSDPNDPTWAPSGGCTRKNGAVTNAEFTAFLGSPLSPAVIGHPAEPYLGSDPNFIHFTHPRIKVPPTSMD